MQGVPGDLVTRDAYVLEQLLAGKGKSAIASELGIYSSQVTGSLRRIFAKLGIKNLIELGAWAQRTGRLGGGT